MELLDRERDEAAQTHGKDAIALLKADHKKVSDLLKDFEEAEGASKRRIADQICNELHVHAQIEEEIAYPAARRYLQREDQELVNEADVEHASTKGLVGRIEDTALSDFLHVMLDVLAQHGHERVEVIIRRTSSFRS